jgi:hypothetical protein
MNGILSQLTNMVPEPVLQQMLCWERFVRAHPVANNRGTVILAARKATLNFRDSISTEYLGIIDFF